MEHARLRSARVLSRDDHVGEDSFCMRISDPQTDVAPSKTRGRNVRSKNQCSMCPAIHTKSRSWLRSSSTREPSDPLLRVVFSVFFKEHSGISPFAPCIRDSLWRSHLSQTREKFRGRRKTVSLLPLLSRRRRRPRGSERDRGNLEAEEARRTPTLRAWHPEGHSLRRSRGGEKTPH